MTPKYYSLNKVRPYKSDHTSYPILISPSIVNCYLHSPEKAKVLWVIEPTNSFRSFGAIVLADQVKIKTSFPLSSILSSFECFLMLCLAKYCECNKTVIDAIKDTSCELHSIALDLVSQQKLLESHDILALDALSLFFNNKRKEAVSIGLSSGYCSLHPKWEHSLNKYILNLLDL